MFLRKRPILRRRCNVGRAEDKWPHFAMQEPFRGGQWNKQKINGIFAVSSSLDFDLPQRPPARFREREACKARRAMLEDECHGTKKRRFDPE